MGGMIGFQFGVDQPQLLKSLTIVNSAPEVKLRSRDDYWQWFKRWSLMRVLSLAPSAKPWAAFFPTRAGGSAAENGRTLGKKRQTCLSRQLRCHCGLGRSGTTFPGTCPTLIVSADRDYTPVALKETYVKLLPDARLVVIADSRHATPLDQPERFNQTLLEFLAAADTNLRITDPC
jgi:pimeloyl-ACP methyl ester carboxylesterase